MWGSPDCCVCGWGTAHEAGMCNHFWDSQESTETELGQRGGANTGLLEVCPITPTPGQEPTGYQPRQSQDNHNLKAFGLQI